MSTTLNAVMSGAGTGMGVATLAMMAKRKCKRPIAWAVVGGLTLLEAIGTFDSLKTLTKERNSKINTVG